MTTCSCYCFDYDDSDKPESEKYHTLWNMLIKRHRVEKVIMVHHPSMILDHDNSA